MVIEEMVKKKYINIYTRQNDQGFVYISLCCWWQSCFKKNNNSNNLDIVIFSSTRSFNAAVIASAWLVATQ